MKSCAVGSANEAGTLYSYTRAISPRAFTTAQPAKRPEDSREPTRVQLFTYECQRLHRGSRDPGETRAPRATYTRHSVASRSNTRTTIYTSRPQQWVATSRPLSSRERGKKNRQLSWKHDDNATVRFVTISEPAWKRGSEASASSRRTNPFRGVPPVTIHPSRLSAIASRCSFYFSKHPQSRNLKKQQQTRNQVKTAAKTSRDLEHDLFVVYTVLSRFLSRFLFFFFDFLWQTGTVGRRGNELKSERV